MQENYITKFDVSTRKQIENEHWQEQLQAFTSTFKGRPAAIAALGMTLVENKPLIELFMIPTERKRSRRGGSWFYPHG